MGSDIIVAADPLREKDNVLVLFPGRLCVATLPPAAANRLEREVSRAAIETAIDTHCWEIALPDLTEVEGRAGSGLLALCYRGPAGEARRESFTAEKSRITQLLDALPREAGGFWNAETLRDNAGMAGAIVYWGCGLLLAVITAVFSLGIAAGWITSGPAILISIVNLFGLTGLLVTGGILVVLCFLAGCKTILFPGEFVRLKRS